MAWADQIAKDPDGRLAMFKKIGPRVAPKNWKFEDYSVKRLINYSAKFHLGDYRDNGFDRAGEQTRIRHILELEAYRLPFEVCWFEYEGEAVIVDETGFPPPGTNLKDPETRKQYDIENSRVCLLCYQINWHYPDSKVVAFREIVAMPFTNDFDVGWFFGCTGVHIFIDLGSMYSGVETDPEKCLKLQYSLKVKDWMKRPQIFPYRTAEENVEEWKKLAQSHSQMTETLLRNTCRALNCKNATYIVVDPNKNNQRRPKGPKRLLYKYHHVVVTEEEMPKKVYEWDGKTRNPPQIPVQWIMGKLRTYPDEDGHRLFGKWYGTWWWPEHRIGKEIHGFRTKEWIFKNTRG